MNSRAVLRDHGHPSPRLAIVGGGQLGTFLCQAARRLGIRTMIITPDGAAPALAVCDSAIKSSFDAPGLAEKIAAWADVVTFELEDVPLELLHDLAAQEVAGRLFVRPAAATLSLLKNKARQKAWLSEHGFPTLPFVAFDDPTMHGADLVDKFGLPLVQKAQTGGYDGYGIQLIRDRASLEKLWPVPSVIEPFLKMSHELAVVVARSVSGEVRVYPPVRMTFHPERHVLDMLITPSGLGEDIDRRARELASAVIEQLEGIGIFAIEMFLDEDGGIVINEISPRVHNSGHVTLETAAVSQFEQHVRAVCGLPLSDPATNSRHGVMRNLLYDDHLEPLMKSASGPMVISRDDARVYWYGKQSAHAGRKMGHVTLLSDDVDHAGEAMDRVIDSISREFKEAAT